MATNNYIQMQIISRNMDIRYSEGVTKKVQSKGKLTAKTGINLTSSQNANYANLPNAGTNETWYGVKYGSDTYYGKTKYAPFGDNGLQLSVTQEGLKFVIDLVHTETNGNGKTFETTALLRTTSGYGKFVYAPFDNVINGWVSVNENNVLRVYVDSTNDTYFDGLSSSSRNQVFIQVIGHWEPATSTYNITDGSSNCTGSNTQTTIEQGENYTNTFTPNDGFAFNENNKPYAVCAGVTYQSTLNQDGTATITITNVSGNIEIRGGAIAKYNLNLELYNCVLCDGERLYFRSSAYQTTNKLISNNSDNILYVENSNSFRTLPNGTKLFIKSVHDASGKELLVMDGSYLYISDGIVKLHWEGNDVLACNINVDIEYLYNYVLEGGTYNFVLHSNDGFLFKTTPNWTMGEETGHFELNASDKTIATIRWNLYPYITISGNLSIQANATLSASLKYGFVSIYNPTYDELDELSKLRFYSMTGTEVLDLSQYIISLRKLYVDIPQIARELVYFGGHNTNVSSNIVTTNFIETDCGTITIDEYNKNSLDYNGVEIDLYLPFIGNVSLNPNQVYGKPLRLVYRTNPLNGDCVAVILSDNVQISYSQGNVSFDVPINFKYGNLNNYGTNDNALYMAGLQPYIEVRTNRQYQNMNSRLLHNNLWVQISDCSGYVLFNDVELRPSNKINKDEWDEIVSLLQGGIIV